MFSAIGLLRSFYSWVVRRTASGVALRSPTAVLGKRRKKSKPTMGLLHQHLKSDLIKCDGCSPEYGFRKLLAAIVKVAEI